MESGRYWNDSTDYLEHHGVLGMKWGVRRYQNADGSLTDKGKKRYYSGSFDRKKQAKGYKRHLNDLDEEQVTLNRNRKTSVSNRDSYRNTQIKYGKKAMKQNDIINDNKKSLAAYAMLGYASDGSHERAIAKATKKRTKYSTKSIKAGERADLWDKDVKDLDSQISSAKKQTNSIINKARSEGMTVNSKSCIRWEGRGRATVTALVDLVSPVKFIPIGDDMIPSMGTSYSVKAKR